MNFKRNQERKEDTSKALFGHPELDAILANSLQKGQIIVIERDSPTTIWKQFLRCSIGHAQINDFPVIIIDNNTDWTKIVPVKASQQQQQDNTRENQIAWRYSKLQTQTLPIDPNNHKMDLSKTAPARGIEQIATDGQQLLQVITSAYQKALKSSTDTGLKKLIINEIELLPIDQMLEFLYGLKILIRSSYMLCIITVENSQHRPLIQQFADFYLSITQIFGNDQFSDFQGVLQIHKVAALGSYKQLTLDTDRWGIKSTNRSLTIEMLYETAVQEDSDDDKPRLACGANPKDRHHLDF